jgi:dTDP-4-dehydrorhamnose 3,5-epimerase
MRFSETSIPGVILIEPDVFRDARGYFLETFNSAKYSKAGIPQTFVQDNQSVSLKNTLRGLHMQVRKPQGKLVRAVEGEIWDVAVDLRPDSATLGQWTAAILSGENFHQFYVPPGCAHGFCVLSESAQVQYKVTELYDPADEAGIAYNDPSINITWPITSPLLSERDRRNPSLGDAAERIGLVLPSSFRAVVATSPERVRG